MTRELTKGLHCALPRAALSRARPQIALGLIALLCGGACTGSVAEVPGVGDHGPLSPVPLDPDGPVATPEGLAPSLPGSAPAAPDVGTVMTNCEGDGYEAVPAHAYAAKVKTLLVGTPLSDAELEAVRTKPDALRELVRGWLDDPLAKSKLLTFFKTAFHQAPFTSTDLMTQFGIGNGRLGVVPGENTDVRYALVRMFGESFARTALHLVETGQPFHKVATTDSFMMTTVMMTALAFLDDRVQPESDKPYYRQLEKVIAAKSYTDERVARMDTLDPANPNFMRFATADGASVPECAGVDATLPSATFDDVPIRCLLSTFGQHSSQRDAEIGPSCSASPPSEDGWLPIAAYHDWHLVKVRRPAAGEVATQFYDVLRGYLKSGSSPAELALHTPRVGYFTTPAFFAVWPTNEDNSARVTVNQTLIVGLGYSLNTASAAAPAAENFFDDAHSAPGTPCYGCHIILDPLRNFFRKEFSVFGSEQTDPTLRAEPATFWVGAVKEEGRSIADLGRLIGQHPLFARAWTQKLCFAANSRPCPEDNPEFERVVAAFEASNYDFRTLMVELYASPLVTGRVCLDGTVGNLPSVSRLRHFCASLSSRTKLPDACGIAAVFASEKRPYTKANAALANTIPDDEFSRGDADPITISENNLFTLGAYDGICTYLAPHVVSAKGLLDPARPAESIAVLTEQFVGLPKSDPRHDGMLAILSEHLQQARDKGDASAAMQSTFVLACTSPFLTGIGF